MGSIPLLITVAGSSAPQIGGGASLRRCRGRLRVECRSVGGADRPASSFPAEHSTNGSGLYDFAGGRSISGVGDDLGVGIHCG